MKKSVAYYCRNQLDLYLGFQTTAACKDFFTTTSAKL